jgi:tetratricopeptide (TPR) repeat protein
MARERQGRYEEAVACNRRAVALKPGYAPYHCNLALALRDAGQTEEADAEFSRAFRLDPNWPFTATRTAWKLATSPEPPLRNGFLALRLARQCCHVGGDAHPAPLDALAAAYAELGRFDEAVDAARRALALASSQGQTELAGQIQERLRLYTSRQPFRTASPGRPRQRRP